MQKAQATVEFILVLMLATAYIAAIIQPNADYSSNSITDVTNIAKLSVSAEKISNAVQYVSVSGAGTRQTVEIIVPSDSLLKCEPAADSNSVRFVYTLKSGRGIAACESDLDAQGTGQSDCNRLVAIGPKFNCSGASVTSGIITPGIYSAAIEKNGSGAVTATFSVVQ